MPAAHLEGRRTRDCCSLSVAPGRVYKKKDFLFAEVDSEDLC